MNKKLLIGSLSLAIVGISCLAIVSKPTYKTIDNSNLDERMAVYIKNETGNYEKSNNIPTSGYVLNEEKSTCNNNAIPTWNRTDNSLNIKDLSNNTSCFLYFDKKELTASEGTLVKLNIANVNIEDVDFSKIADTDEGIFEVADPMYGENVYSYYYRGAVTNNYVQFGGFCWRIIRINGDGSIRMIYDGTTCHANGISTEESIVVANQTYNSSANRSEYVGYAYTEGLQRPTDNATATSSNLKIQTESWYKTNITNKGYDGKVAEGKFCNDKKVASGYSWESQPKSKFYYSTYSRLYLAKAPTLSCDAGDVYTLKAGAITADEVNFAGGKYASQNKLYYLYNGQRYWTMSPYYFYFSGYYYYAHAFAVDISGHLGALQVDSASRGVRPVINLRSDIIISSGNGTIDNPYVVEGA